MISGKKELTIVGAGLVGSLLAILLGKKGFNVKIFDRRPDPRVVKFEGGRSINLALSHRGIKALALAGIEGIALEQAIPMKGRMVHDVDGKQHFHPYGDEGQMIYSISRAGLNELLIEEAGRLENVHFEFEKRCIEANLAGNALSFFDEKNKATFDIESDIVFGADGAFSAIRSSLIRQTGFNYAQDYLEHGYKELSIPSDNGKHRMEKNALHIWPRESFMLIALPNADGSFTCTLFLSLKGNNSFAQLSDDSSVKKFFAENFPDTLMLMPDLEKDFFQHPTSTLVTIHCYPWKHRNMILLGDAAHAIVPFYGQGMNAGFEDCRVLMQILENTSNNWEEIFEKFQQSRKPDADAISELALRNFIEMRDLVNDEKFILRKKIEGLIHSKYGKAYLPLYSMVTFSDLNYKEALETGKKQDQLMENILNHPGIEDQWNRDDFWNVIDDYVKKYFFNL